MSSEALGPPRQTEEVTPIPTPFFPSPPVVLGCAFTAMDGRRALLRHLLREKKCKKKTTSEGACGSQRESSHYREVSGHRSLLPEPSQEEEETGLVPFLFFW
ncbi:hypothetical protein SK128_027861, partial [Halocaridina rubra]